MRPMKSRAQRTRVAIALFVLTGIYLMVSRQPSSDPAAVASADPSASPAVVASASSAPDPAAAPASPGTQVAAAPVAAPSGAPAPSPGASAAPAADGGKAERKRRRDSDPGASPGAGAAPETVTKRKVLHSRREIPQNTRFSPSNVERYLVEREIEVYPGSEAFTEGTSSVFDLVARDIIPAGDMLVRGKLMNLGETSRLSVSLADGKRAISVNISMENGVAGFISQGDHVDILHHMSQEGREQTYVLLENIRVLTISNAFRHAGAPRPAQPPGPDGQPPPGGGGGRAQDVVRAENMTQVVFEVTPQEAEFLIQAENAPGNLSLVLRGLEVSQDFRDVSPITDEFLYSGKREVMENTEGRISTIEVYRGGGFKKEVRLDRLDKEKPKFEDDPEVYLTPEE